MDDAPPKPNGWSSYPKENSRFLEWPESWQADYMKWRAEQGLPDLSKEHIERSREEELQQEWENCPGDINIVLKRTGLLVDMIESENTPEKRKLVAQIPKEELMAVLQHCVMGVFEVEKRYHKGLQEVKDAGMYRVDVDSYEQRPFLELLSVEEARHAGAEKLREQVMKAAATIRDFRKCIRILEEGLGKKIVLDDEFGGGKVGQDQGEPKRKMSVEDSVFGVRRVNGYV